MEVPEIDAARCTFCGKWRQEICQFNAIAVLPNVASFTFRNHAIAARLLLVCPEQAVISKAEAHRHRGERRAVDRFAAHAGCGWAKPWLTPLIRGVRERRLGRRAHSIIDAPPGTSCPVLAAVLGSDLVILVTEPTPWLK